MDIKISGHEYYYDITSMSMLFFPGEKVNYVKRSLNPTHIISSLKVNGDKYISTTKIKYCGKFFSSSKRVDLNCDTKNLVKQTFYNACSKATGIESPWGILTGIRPLSVYMRHLNGARNVGDIMKREYYLVSSKISILDKVYENERMYFNSSSKDVSIYISVPFCPTKCTYCSFISVSATGLNNLLNDYLILLEKEIKQKAQLIKKYALNLKSIYIGGGTPGVLDKFNIRKLFETLEMSFDLKSIEEITFEIGRPETINMDKLNILKHFGVNRICINTQTTNDDILCKVNRCHTANDYFNSVELAKKVGFEIINTDLIAGLPGDNYESFCKTVDDIIKTGVNNITIHTLAIKRAAQLSDHFDNYKAVDNIVNKMLEYAYVTLDANGYSPYYIYRQKNCVSNGENIGFCKIGTQCKYNIYMMEDVHSIISCGAGASTKIVDGNRVQRVINVKYPKEYINMFDHIENNTHKIDELLKETF